MESIFDIIDNKEENEFVAVDVETTGLSPLTSELI